MSGMFVISPHINSVLGVSLHFMYGMDSLRVHSCTTLNTPYDEELHSNEVSFYPPQKFAAQLLFFYYASVLQVANLDVTLLKLLFV